VKTIEHFQVFTEFGFVQIEEAFPRADAQTMCELIWDVLERHFGIKKADPSTWNRPFRKGPLDEIGDSPVFWSVFGDRLVSIVDDLLGEGAWSLPETLGDFLITFPNTFSWELPHEGWHSDDGFVPGIIAFVFLNDVAPQGGGTLIVQSSHRLPRADSAMAAPDGEGRKWKHRWEMERAGEWMRALRTPADPTARHRMFMEEVMEQDGIPLRVVELTGKAGDAVLCHPRLVHAIAPNATATPRFMRTPRIRGLLRN
jgi:hypothetical protein